MERITEHAQALLLLHHSLRLLGHHWLRWVSSGFRKPKSDQLLIV
jgi:hypothetical protein